MRSSWPTAASIPIRRRAGNPTASIALRPCSFPNRTAGRTTAWRGIAREDLVIYELHVGTFTPEGTFDAIIPRLPQLLSLGVTAVELMPVAQFPGDRNWGYDGVYPYAVQNSYGGPRALQRLVDAAHQAGLAVILDVVYNHLGPEGNYLGQVRPLFHRSLSHAVGKGHQLRRAGQRRRCGSSSSTTPACGCAISTSTVCGSTRSTRSTTSRPRHILAEIQAAVQREADSRRPPRPRHRREQPERRPPDPPAGARRLRAGRRLERRFSPQRPRAADRRARRLLPGFRPGRRTWPRR